MKSMFNFLVPLFLLVHGQALAQLCEKLVFSDFDSFTKAMTEGLALRERQDSIMNLYLQNQTPYPTAAQYKSLHDVIEVLNHYPELSKIPIREQILEFSTFKRKKPESLKSFIASFQKSAGKIRNSLFHIEDNIGFWMHMLGFPHKVWSPDKSVGSFPPDKGGQGGSFLGKKSSNKAAEFIAYLNTTTLNENTRDFIKDTSQPDREKAIRLYRALEQIRSDLLNSLSEPNQKVIQNISQAMANLVWIVGFSNQDWVQGLKSSDPDISFSALRSIINEKDILAFELGFEGHFKELKEKLNSKIPDETPLLQQIQEDIQNQASPITGKEILRLRPLSLQESPFRSCLSGDCASNTYFEKALDPNFLYWTLTDSQMRSSGHLTVVLGKAKNKKGQRVRVGFVDKIHLWKK